MSTPIEQNTTDLQNILNAVNELPEAGGGGGSAKWEVIAEGELTEETTSIYITADMDGNPFELTEGTFGIIVKGSSANTDKKILRLRTNINTAANGGTVNIVGGMRPSGGSSEHQFAFCCSIGVLHTGWSSSQGTIAGGQNVKFNTLTAIYWDGTEDGGKTFGVGTKWVLRGVRK